MAKINNIPGWKLDQLACNPKEYMDFFLTCLDGDRRSGRSERLAHFYANMVVRGDNPRIIDHFMLDYYASDRYDKALTKRVCKELTKSGYLQTTDYHLMESAVGRAFLVNQAGNKVRMVTKEDVIDCMRRWKNSIAHTTAFNRAFAGHD